MPRKKSKSNPACEKCGHVPMCPTHGTPMVVIRFCPKERGAKAGQKRKALSRTPEGRKKISRWGKAGGRPKEQS